MHAHDYTRFGFYPLYTNIWLFLAVLLFAPLSSLKRSNLTRAFSDKVGITADEYCSEVREYKSIPMWILLHRLYSD